MATFVIIVHVLVSLLLILSVLLQPGNKGGMGAAFGGAGGATVFGGRGANTFLAKLTAGAAVVFMLTSMGLVYLSSKGTSAFDRMPGVTTPVSDDGDKADEAKGEETKADDAKAGDTKAEEAPAADAKADAPKADEGAAAPAPVEGAPEAPQPE